LLSIAGCCAVSGNLARLMSSYELFTDGACSGNPGPGGWGFILRGGGAAEREESGGEPSTTNNRMELTAVIRGLDELADGSTVVVTTDSEYCVKGLNEWMDGWKKRGWRKADRSPVMNRDLWEQLDAHRSRLRLRAQWIRGHNEHPENERCDRLAVAAIDQVRRSGASVRVHGASRGS
jgi:ribonuclease HI